VNEVVFADKAVRLFRKFPKSDRASIKEGIRQHLAEADPRQQSRNKFRLRRASPFAEYELRLDRWRIFYRVQDERVEVILIGEKRGNKLLIAGEDFML
jgi:mRNA-degrading endonuclease RelE of RelBE toxin-antitoxin system